ncbi:MAG: hypothetical protein COU22_00720 [Candidatus Komeilibacteria bacterium CG10_big_fil_rev_8_21_14_0_10_41_13]|uniref:Prepilin-type N-terminal cleavage/methylation domain-containing protein n=1 Tax=Candidatus Komeilibacteria bacterium CG10_big_fil_rev_8_21_14_0_10_41_13 TaxID=1974476 RepID=A0A2M6WD38_9BACT|nr:MAG: hypothetical protein COU22_00720 [Candidatus Komeilibacteria bacterium CG10_big_fil_rev_8_21_14_0_10_41_13]
MRKKNNQGMTIIEILLAFAIILVGVFSVITIFPYSLSASKNSVNKTIAINLAQARMEEMISSSYNTLTAGQTVENSLDSIHQDFTAFSRETNVTYVDEDLADSVTDLGLKKINVNVYWYDLLDKSTSTVSLYTLIANF